MMFGKVNTHHAKVLDTILVLHALINSVVSEVLDENKLKLEEYLSGKERLFGFFVGQAF